MEKPSKEEIEKDNESFVDLMELAWGRAWIRVLEEDYQEREATMNKDFEDKAVNVLELMLNAMRYMTKSSDMIIKVKLDNIEDFITNHLGEEETPYGSHFSAALRRSSRLSEDVVELKSQIDGLQVENNKLAAGCCEHVETNAYGNKTCSIEKEINSLSKTLAAAQRIRDLKCKESDNLFKENMELKREIADKDATIQRLRKQLPPIDIQHESELLRSDFRAFHISELRDALGICIAAMEQHKTQTCDKCISRTCICG